MSVPTLAPICPNSSFVKLVLYIIFNPISTPAASVDSPPNPDIIGILFLIDICILFNFKFVNSKNNLHAL